MRSGRDDNKKQKTKARLHADGDEFLDGFGAERVGGRLGEIGDADGTEQAGNGVIDTRQRFFDGAGVGEVAGVVVRAAGGDEEGTVDGVDNFKGGDFARLLEERIATAHAGMGAEDANFGQTLQDLREQLRRDVIGDRDIPGAERLVVGVLGEEFEGHEAVVGFFGEPEHSSPV